MKKSKIKYSESDLMEFVRSDFENLGYTTYAEVLYNKTGKRCDLYAIIEDKNHQQYGMTIAFEAKLSFNLKVIQQANFWKDKAHNVYIIVPTTYKDIQTRKFAREICEKLGIGVLEVNILQNKYFMTVKSGFIDKPKYPTLYKEQKDIISSNNNNSYVTPFKLTVTELNKYMENKKSDYLLNVVKNIKHHYSSNSSAITSLKNLITKGIIKNFYISRNNNKIIINKI